MNGLQACAVVLLAAGTAQRFGRLKQLEPLHGESLVRRAARTALATGLPVWLVTGAQQAQVEAEVADLPLHCVHNPDWSRGMGSTLALGARLAGQGLGALIVMLADQPLVEARDLLELLQVHADDPQAIVAADHGDTLGPPCLFPAAYLPALIALDGERGARALLKQHADAVRRLPMPHAALDIDTPQDLARAEALIAARATSS